jgi:hypothetical protein
MNLDETRGFCSAREIPYRIVAESSNGKVKATKDTDRKPIVLARVRRYLRTGQVGHASRISVQIVRRDCAVARVLGSRDRLTIVGTRRSSRVSCGGRPIQFSSQLSRCIRR